MPETVSNASLGDALQRGVAFLERAQLPSGEIPVLASGKPDPAIFPTAAAAHSLSFEPRASGVRDRALDFLLSQGDARGLWKHWPESHPYHHQLPPDLDDTACASAALAKAGRRFPDNRELLIANRDRRGLFYTWKLTRDQLVHPLVLYSFFRKTSAKPFDVDAVVNANVLFYLGPIPETRAVAEHLLSVLRDGSERACDKWYDNPFAVWYFFSRALHAMAPDAGEIIAAKIASSAKSSALDHALACAALAYWNREADVAPLLAMQLDSGAWPATPLYHGGRRRHRDGSFDEPHPDTPYWGSESLTTAFCIEALSRASHGGGSAYRRG